MQLQESGHYDDGVRIVEKWMDQHQDDNSKDDFLHQQISDGLYKQGVPQRIHPIRIAR